MRQQTPRRVVQNSQPCRRHDIVTLLHVFEQVLARVRTTAVRLVDDRRVRVQRIWTDQAAIGQLEQAVVEERGVADSEIARVHRPIGLNIGSRTPAEIAVATLAGLIADRNGRPGGFY